MTQSSITIPYSRGLLLALSDGMLDDDGGIRAVDVTGIGCRPGKDESPTGVDETNWADLPRDVLLLIFKKIAAFWIIRSAQFVCRSWLLLSHDPELWRCIDMRGHSDILSLLDLEPMAMEAVDRSRGRLEEFCAENFGSDALMSYIAERTTQLRSLRLISTYLISDKGLIREVSRYPQLEELEISLCIFSSEFVGLLGQACPHLKSFKLVQQPWMVRRGFEYERDEQALAIAKHMRQLRRLQLDGNTITGTGLVDILDNCSYLECLDIRRCSQLKFDEDLRKKCARIKDFRFSNDDDADNGPWFYDYDRTALDRM